jgi:hypothetical protein
VSGGVQMPKARWTLAQLVLLVLTAVALLGGVAPLYAHHGICIVTRCGLRPQDAAIGRSPDDRSLILVVSPCRPEQLERVEWIDVDGGNRVLWAFERVAPGTTTQFVAGALPVAFRETTPRQEVPPRGKDAVLRTTYRHGTFESNGGLDLGVVGRIHRAGALDGQTPEQFADRAQGGDVCAGARSAPVRVAPFVLVPMAAIGGLALLGWRRRATQIHRQTLLALAYGPPTQP